MQHVRSRSVNNVASASKRKRTELYLFDHQRQPLPLQLRSLVHHTIIRTPIKLLDDILVLSQATEQATNQATTGTSASCWARMEAYDN